MPPPSGLPPVCYIRNWIAFGEGFWKGQLYSRADCLTMGRNFQRLSTGPDPLIVPRVKIGHDVQGRLEQSLGFPALGRIYGLRVAQDGLCAFDLEIPTQIGALRNAGRYVDGSIEIAPPLPDPDDATKELYPVLTAISLLGEEQPAVPLRYPMPMAVFADGRPVPAEHDLTPLAQAMAEVAKAFSANARPATGSFAFRGKTYSTAVVCFSAMTPVTPVSQGNRPMPLTPEQKTALAAPPFNYPPEKIAAMDAAEGSQMATVPAVDPNAQPTPAPPAAAMATDKPDDSDPMAAMSKKFAADPQTPAYAKEMMSAFSVFAAECKKQFSRFSATEAAVGEMQKDKPAMQAAAAFASTYQKRLADDKRAAVERVVDQAITEGRLMRIDRDDKVTAGLAKNDATTFSAGHAHAGKTEYQAWVADLLARKPSHMFSNDATFAEPAPGDPTTDPFLKRALASLPGGRELAYPLPTAAVKK